MHGSEDYYKADAQLKSMLTKLDTSIAGLTLLLEGLSEGGDLLNKLDALDGTVDGKLDVTQLTNVQANLLAKLLGIESWVITAPELATNGTFDTDTSWTKGDGWSIAAGVAHCDGSQSTATTLFQQSDMVLDKRYRLTFTLYNCTAGAVQLSAGLTGHGTWRSTNGTYTENIICSGNIAIRLGADTDFVGDIDDVSVKLAYPVGSSMIDKLDALDGTMDGKLDLTQLNTSAVQEAVEGRRYEGYAKITTACKEVIHVWHEGFYNASFYSHPDNTADIGLYGEGSCTADPFATLSPGDLYGDAGGWDNVWAKAVSGTQYLRVEITGRSTT